MTGALAAAPQINAFLFIDSGYQGIGVARGDKGPLTFTEDYRRDASVRAAMAVAKTSESGVWGEPLWRREPDTTLLNFRLGVRRDGEFLGLLIATVTVRELSGYLGALDPAVGSNVFILYDRSHVLAHPNLEFGGPELSEEKPLPTLDETGDPVLSSIWQQEGRYPLEVTKGTGLQGHALDLFNDQYIYIYREITGYGGLPWQVGSYFRGSDVNTEMLRLRWAALAGLGMLLIAVASAIVLGRRIARPVVELAAAASHIGKLEISETGELPGSVFRELNDQARAFNTMLRGLRWFEIYVPRKLVHRLVGHGEAGSTDSVEREVTVMFTDIARFSSLSEGVPASEIAEFLNRHFALLAACIEDEEGTLDKFIGDSIMAFWGAPDDQPDHAERAARAARAIGVAVKAENEARRAAGEAPVGVRIGLHSGPVTVGNIGAPGRINYTIIGDAVNIGQRLEQLGKQFPSEAGGAVTILASAATVERLGPEFPRESLGDHRLRGRQEMIEVFRLR